MLEARGAAEDLRDHSDDDELGEWGEDASRADAVSEEGEIAPAQLTQAEGSAEQPPDAQPESAAKLAALAQQDHPLQLASESHASTENIVAETELGEDSIEMETEDAKDKQTAQEEANIAKAEERAKKDAVAALAGAAKVAQKEAALLGAAAAQAEEKAKKGAVAALAEAAREEAALRDAQAEEKATKTAVSPQKEGRATKMAMPPPEEAAREEGWTTLDVAASTCEAVPVNLDQTPLANRVSSGNEFVEHEVDSPRPPRKQTAAHSSNSSANELNFGRIGVAGAGAKVGFNANEALSTATDVLGSAAVEGLEAAKSVASSAAVGLEEAKAVVALAWSNLSDTQDAAKQAASEWISYLRSG
mmetsp:Transcript_35808/g.89101  ORF Transcript_35808/g.89101 Transcript_35808/m.89101 type:complete len:361 (-) Transcript_35808:334-1416(-)